MKDFEDAERFISSNMISEDIDTEVSLRPKTMFKRQKNVKRVLTMSYYMDLQDLGKPHLVM